MLEAARGGYWQADAATVSELKQRYRELAQTYDVKTDNAKLAAYTGLSGLGLDAPALKKMSPQETAAANAAKTPRATQTITKPSQIQRQNLQQQRKQSAE
jgi:cobaltochelatase CobN